MCSADMCQLQGWDLQDPLGAPGPQGHCLSVSPLVTWSPGAQSQPSTEPLVPAGFPEHTECTCVPDLQVTVHTIT